MRVVLLRVKMRDYRFKIDWFITSKGTCKRSHQDIQGKPKGKLGTPIPSGHVIRDPGQHSGFEDSEKEPDARYCLDVVNESSSDTADTEAERSGRYKPSRSDPFAEHIARNLEDNVTDVEN